MGRHADSTRKRGFRVPIGIISIVVVLLCAAALGIWWWSLRSQTDPIDANPVDAYGVVVTSPSCPTGGVTTVTVSGTNPPVTATLDACGYRVGEQLPIQYLAGHPQTVRLAGTSTAGTHSLAARLLPIGILAAGLIAVLATVALLIDRRRSRHQVGPTPRRAGRRPIAVAVGPGLGTQAAGVASDGTTGGLPDSVAGTTALPADDGGDANPDVVADETPAGGVATSQDAMFPEDDYGARYQDSVYPAPNYAGPVAPEPDSVQDLERSVVIDGGTLFTHTNPEPPEPAGAPVEWTGDEAERG
jgi:hypothetical protein